MSADDDGRLAWLAAKAASILNVQIKEFHSALQQEEDAPTLDDAIDVLEREESGYFVFTKTRQKKNSKLASRHQSEGRQAVCISSWMYRPNTTFLFESFRSDHANHNGSIRRF